MFKVSFFSVFFGVVLAFSADLPAETEHDHHHNQHHKQLEVSDWADKPQIQIKLHPDAKSGWNLEVITQHFEFAPDQVNQAHVEGKGHGHLYIDGQKVGRLYSHWRHISGLKPGKHQIKVTLNSNDHQDYVVKGVIIGDQLEIIQK